MLLSESPAPGLAALSSPQDVRAREITRSVSDHYDRLAQPYTEAFFEDVSDSPWLDRLLVRLPLGARVLDAGCGPGRLARYMAGQGCAVTGIDLSSKMIDAAKRLVPEATFRVMDMSQLHFGAESFDGVFAAYSLFHVPPERLDQTLGEFRRVLVTGGFAAFIVKRGMGERLVPSPLVPGETCYLQLWDPAEFATRLVSCGFQVVEHLTAAPDSAEELPFERLFFLAQRA